MPLAEAGTPDAVPAPPVTHDVVRDDEASILETVMEVLGDGYHQWPHVGQVPVSRTVPASRAVSGTRAASVSVSMTGTRSMAGDLVRAGPDHPRLRYHHVRQQRLPCHRREKRWGDHMAPELIVDPPPF